MKKRIKSIFAVGFAGIVFCTNAFAAENLVYLNNGFITYEGTTAKNKKVTMSITKEEYDLIGETSWKNVQSDKAAYFGDTTSDTDGKYSFLFKLNDNGMYKMYVGIDGVDEAEVYTVEYTDKTLNDTAIGLLKTEVESGTAAGVTNLLNTKRSDFRLYSDVYDISNTTAAGKMVYDYFKANGASTDSDTVKKVILKALSAAAINTDTVSDVNDYVDEFGILGNNLNKYYKSENAASILTMMSAQEITSLDDFDYELWNAVVTTAINTNDGTGVISDILNDYYTKLGITTSQITNNLVSAVANHGTFTSTDDLKTFLSTYQEPQSNGGVTTGGTGGGGGASPSTGMGGYIPPSSAIEQNQSVKLSFFDDVDVSFWAADAINKLYEKGIIAGKSATEFYPADTVKREEFVKMLVTSFKFDIINGDMSFDDVTVDDWYYEYVRSAYLGYIVNGVSENLFGSGKNITRQDMAVMINNALKASDIVLPQNQAEIHFDDDASISAYAKESVKTLQTAGIISGYKDNTFKPHGNATRAEAATIIYRILSYIK